MGTCPIQFLTIHCYANWKTDNHDWTSYATIIAIVTCLGTTVRQRSSHKIQKAEKNLHLLSSFIIERNILSLLWTLQYTYVSEVDWLIHFFNLASVIATHPGFVSSHLLHPSLLYTVLNTLKQTSGIPSFFKHVSTSRKFNLTEYEYKE